MAKSLRFSENAKLKTLLPNLVSYSTECTFSCLISMAVRINCQIVVAHKNKQNDSKETCSKMCKGRNDSIRHHFHCYYLNGGDAAVLVVVVVAFVGWAMFLQTVLLVCYSAIVDCPQSSQTLRQRKLPTNLRNKECSLLFLFNVSDFCVLPQLFFSGKSKLCTRMQITAIICMVWYDKSHKGLYNKTPCYKKNFILYELLMHFAYVQSPFLSLLQKHLFILFSFLQNILHYLHWVSCGKFTFSRFTRIAFQRQ